VKIDKKSEAWQLPGFSFRQRDSFKQMMPENYKNLSNLFDL